MARKLTVHMNQIAPAGYIELYKSIEIDNKKFKKIWAEFWDISILKDKMWLTPPETENPKLWIWHGLVNNEVKFHTMGDNINEFVLLEKPDKKDKTMYILKKVKK